ncbi:MAG: tRNA-binding protein [Candidatus Zixiibacteriota bacterium]
MTTIDYSDFEKLDIRVGKIIEIADFERARVPAYKLKIDLGPEIGIKQTSARFKTDYTPDQLLGRQCLCVVNFEPKNIGGFMSEVLMLGVPRDSSDTGSIVLVTTESDALLGGRMY